MVERFMFYSIDGGQWGCPICRRQALEQGTKEAVEAAKKAIREAYDRHRTASGDGQ